MDEVIGFVEVDGKEYVQVKKTGRDTCGGCVALGNSGLCFSLPAGCSELFGRSRGRNFGIIYKLKTEVVCQAQ